MKRGFSLIELVIAIGVGVVLLGIGALSLNGLRAGTIVQTEAQELTAALRGAQEKASGQESDSRWGVYFSTNQNPQIYYVYQIDEILKADPEYTAMPGESVDTHALKPSLQMTFELPVTSTIIFAKGSGRPEAATVITISSGDPETEKSVIITAQGRINYE